MKPPKKETSVNICGDKPWHQCSKSDLWNTPDFILNMVRQVQGDYFDPCPPNPEQDGLAIPWLGSVYVNPPYSNVQPWLDKGVDGIRNGDITQITYLLKLDPATLWWKSLNRLPFIYCLLGQRLKYKHQDFGLVSTSPFPSVLIYCGPNAQQFADVMRNIGQVVIGL